MNMKTREAVTARNVVNTEAIDTYIKDKIAEHPAISVWLDKALRKWMLQKAPTTKFAGTPTQGMPDWLKRAMDSNTAEEVVIDEALDNTIAPIIDYIEWVHQDKPNKDLAQIAFDQAAAGSKKWHEDMAKKAAKTKPIEEDGTKVIHVFPNGYYWVKVTGLQSMKREGDIMGHCLGWNGYFQHSLGGRKEIYSLRDPKNGPHVTIETSITPGHVTINQIKGKANRAVNAEYLPMVEAFLKSMKWDLINFDGASPLRQTVTEHKAEKNTTRGKNGTTITRDIAAYFGNKPRFLVTPANGEQHGYYAESHPELPVPAANDFVDFLLANHVYLSPEKMIYTIRQGRWDTTPVQGEGNRATEWFVQTPMDERAKVNARYASRGDENARMIVNDHDDTVGYITGSNIILFPELARNKSVFHLLERMPSVNNGVVSVLKNDHESTPDAKLTEFYQHRHAGATMGGHGRTDDMLGTFLTALRLPNMGTIKAAALALRGKELNDAAFKAHGIPTGGNSTMAYPLVLALSLMNNKVEAMKYLTSKPHAIRNWLDVMGNKMAVMLTRMKFSPEQQEQLRALLYNEYVRLVPSPTELANMGLTPQMVHDITAVAKGHKRNDPNLSKTLWK